MARPNTVVVWEGPSPIDGAPIVAVISGLVSPSSNRKTGPMLQVSILRADMDAMEASRAGADRSICGDCPLRWATGGGCYVNLGQAPLSQSRAYLRGSYPRANLEVVRRLVAGKAVRLGSYGDPAMLPLEVLRALTDTARVWTGYTHQWRTCAPEYADILMASTDTVADRMAATALGWRYFGLASDPTDAPGDAIECLADAKGIACIDCGLCAGNARAGARSILIRPHGARSKRALMTAGGEVKP